VTGYVQRLEDAEGAEAKLSAKDWEEAVEELHGPANF
jgi:hypothetical protein